MPRIGPFELVIVLFIILVIFGVGKLPEIGGAMGKGIRAFKKGQAGEEDEGEKEKAKEESKEPEKSKRRS